MPKAKKKTEPSSTKLKKVFKKEITKEKVEKKTLLTVTDFTQPNKKDGEIKIVSWNVAGFSSILKKGFIEYVKSEDPDIICIQETKIEASNVSASLIPGYYNHFYAAQKKGYSGTGIFSKINPISFKDGIGIEDHDSEGRCITAEYEKFYLVNTYIPNSGRKLVDLDYRKKWDQDFLSYIKKLDSKKPVIWCGDLNVAHQEIDLKNPESNKNKTAGFSDAEREGFSKVLEAGFVDSFRHLYPQEKGAWTFWTYMGNAREKDIGWRLDYFVISASILPYLTECYRRKDVMGSDHCPLVLHIKTPN